MEPTALDQDFARFRTTGDHEALARVFDASAPELLRIARHLTAARADAEDVLQSTFLAVIERAEAHEPSRPVLPWMIGILARQAGLARRRRSSSARLADAEELERAPARDSESPSRTAERREFIQRLGVALAHLPYDTRALVEAHLFDELAGSVLAARAGVTHGALRVRLHRALSIVRRMLPAFVGVLGLERVANASALARVRRSVIGGASPIVARPALPIAAALGAVVLTAAGFAVARSTSELEPAASNSSLAALPLSTAAAERTPIAAETPSTPRALAVDAPSATVASIPVPFRDGRVAERRTDEPIANAEVALRLATGEVLRARSDETGSFRVPVDGAQGLWTLAARADEHAASTNTGEAEDELVVFLDPARRVEGVLVHPDGAPARNAELWLLDDARFLLERVVVKADGEGRFAIDGVSCLYGTTYAARSADGAHARTERWNAAGGDDEGRIVLLPVRELDVHVRTRNEGAPIEGASVVLVPWEGGPRPPLAVAITDLEAAQIAQTDANGLARCARLPVQCYDVLVTAPGWDVRSARIDLRGTAASPRIEFELDRSATIEVQVLDSDGAPVPNAFVQCVAASDLGGATNTLLRMGVAWPDEWTRAKHADARTRRVRARGGRRRSSVRTGARRDADPGVARRRAAWSARRARAPGGPARRNERDRAQRRGWGLRGLDVRRRRVRRARHGARGPPVRCVRADPRTPRERDRVHSHARVPARRRGAARARAPAARRARRARRRHERRADSARADQRARTDGLVARRVGVRPREYVDGRARRVPRQDPGGRAARDRGVRRRARSSRVRARVEPWDGPRGRERTAACRGKR
ncbi:MAG: RNA polymerase sigma factor [Planctomycetes bacterium]|nr:RNA polymerase sigma factor [Planctomycetota bacterium]